MDYSIHDALEAGFQQSSLHIRKDPEKDFKEVIGKPHQQAKLTEVEYAFQELDDLAGRLGVKPEGRTKLWGTG